LGDFAESAERGKAQYIEDCLFAHLLASGALATGVEIEFLYRRVNHND
jgi:hypothetical protein